MLEKISKELERTRRNMKKKRGKGAAEIDISGRIRERDLLLYTGENGNLTVEILVL